jgi:hypothetical protein
MLDIESNKYNVSLAVRTSFLLVINQILENASVFINDYFKKNNNKGLLLQLSAPHGIGFILETVPLHFAHTLFKTS